MKIVQADLYHQIDASHARTMMTWLYNKPGLKTGVTVTLKDQPNIVWQVINLYNSDEHDVTDFDFHRKWDNNNYDKHEGLKV